MKGKRMKTLIDELAMMDGNQKVKIGAKSSFFFCGTVNEFCENLTDYGDAFAALAQKNVIKAEIQKKKVLEHPPTLSKYTAGECNNPFPNPTIDGYNKAVENWFDTCVQLEGEHRKFKEYLDNYVNLEERDVTDIYKASEAVDDDTKIVVIAGNECGKFWDFSDVKEEKFGLIGG